VEIVESGNGEENGRRSGRHANDVMSRNPVLFFIAKSIGLEKGDAV